MWLNRSKYLHAVTGQQIVDEQAKLHTETSFVVATQPILLKDRSDVACYSALVNRSIRAMRAMERKAFKAVREHWYKADWSSEKKTELLLE